MDLFGHATHASPPLHTYAPGVQHTGSPGNSRRGGPEAAGHAGAGGAGGVGWENLADLVQGSPHHDYERLAASTPRTTDDHHDGGRSKGGSPKKGGGGGHHPGGQRSRSQQGSGGAASRGTTHEALSSDSEEEDDDEEGAAGPGEDVVLPEDIYGAAIYSAIHDSVDLHTGLDQDHLSKWVNGLRMAFVMISLCLTYALQVGIMGWSYRLFVAPSIRTAQELYTEYRAQCFETDGTFSEARWEEWGRAKQEQLCNLALSSFWMLCLLLSLWWMVIANEVRKTDRLRRSFADIPAARTFEEQVEHACRGADGQEHRVRRLVPRIKWMLTILMILPKYAMLFVLLALGTWWLTAASGPNELLVASLALAAVVKLDVLVFEAMYPFRLRREIVTTKLWRREEVQGKAFERRQWAAYLRSTLLWAVLFAGPYLYLLFLQGLPWLGVLPGSFEFNDGAACTQTWEEALAIPCSGWSAWKGADCFPFGSAGTDALPPHPEVYGT